MGNLVCLKKNKSYSTLKSDAQTQTFETPDKSRADQLAINHDVKINDVNRTRAKSFHGQSHIYSFYFSNDQTNSPESPILKQHETQNETQQETKQEIQRQTQKPIDETMSSTKQNKLSRMPAMVEGYLTRRFLKTEKVQQTIRTIKDTYQELINLNLEQSGREVTPADAYFHDRLIAQLESACQRYHDILMSTKKEQMSMIIISNSHNMSMGRHLRSGSKSYKPNFGA